MSNAETRDKTEQEYMAVYMVISYDRDEQQTFWDVVPAPSEEQAEIRISELRPDAVVIDVLDHSLARGIADDLLTCTVEQAEERLAELVAEAESLKQEN